MMIRIIWVLFFILFFMPMWAIASDEIINKPSEEVIMLDSSDRGKRFINIKKSLDAKYNLKKSGSIYMKEQSFHIKEQLTNKNELKVDLDYDDSGVYSSKYKRIDELRVENKGKINDRFEYRLNLIGNNLYSDSDNQRVHTDSYIGAKINKTHKLFLGGSRLSETTKNRIDFLRDVESSYGKNDMGGKLQGSFKKFDYSLGAYKDMSQDNSHSSGGVAAFKPFGENSKIGQLSLGSAYYSKSELDALEKTYGAFSYYKRKRFGIKNEYARNYYGLDDGYNTNWSFSPEFYLTKNLALKTRHKQWYQSEGYVNDFIIEYSVKNPVLPKINNLKLQIKASYIKGFDEDESRRFGLNSQFNF